MNTLLWRVIDSNNNILKLRVGFVEQNISFAGEAMEQVGDGRG